MKPKKIKTMKKEIVIPIKLILIFIGVIVLITVLDGWGGIMSAVKEIVGWCIWMGFLALACYGLYKLGQKFGHFKDEEIDTKL